MDDNNSFKKYKVQKSFVLNRFFMEQFYDFSQRIGSLRPFI